MTTQHERREAVAATGDPETWTDPETRTDSPTPAGTVPSQTNEGRLPTNEGLTLTNETPSAAEASDRGTPAVEPVAIPDTPSARAESGASRSATAPAADESLFAAGELSEFRYRWDDVQSAFVDDPRTCVERADTLVTEVVDRLSAGFSQTRSQLEGQWSRGEEASTEDLRLALKRYREFFQRLLAV